MRLLIDGNSLLNQALLRGTDHEFGRVIYVDDKPVQVNSAQYGVEGFWEKMKAALTKFSVAPRGVIIVWDGAGAKSLRQGWLPTYKAGRDKVAEVSAELNIARDQVSQMALKLGMHVASQKYREADDVIGYLCKYLRNDRNTVVSADGDLAVLVDENTDVWNGHDLNKNPFGGFPHRHITTYKALVGDPSDKIPGARGFGDAAFVDFVRIFGIEGLDEVARMIQESKLEELRESVPDFKPLQKVLDSKDMVEISWKCASLFIDQVNVMGKPLDLRPGMVAQWDELAEELRVYDLKHFYGTKLLVTAKNYAQAYSRVSSVIGESPFVALDIETSSSEASDEWVEALQAATETDRVRVDVLGHELTGMSLTFGANSQHTIYMSVNHRDTDNITVDQCREMVELIPHKKIHTVIQNRQFEFSVLYRTWGDKWEDNGWYGMVPNAIDTKVGASIVDENLKKGLKERSKHHLGYEQATYEETTTKQGLIGSLPVGGVRTKEYLKCVQEAVTAMDPETGEESLVSPAVYEQWEARQYKMSELTGLEVLNYGADDTICTAALHNHYQLVMEIEGTWEAYLQVHTLPEYLTSLAFVQGVPISNENLNEMQLKDNEAYDKAWALFRDFLIENGWDGTECPEFEGDIEPSDAKLAVSIILDGEFTTKKRKLNAIAVDIREQFPNNDTALLLAEVVERNDVNTLNTLVKQHFSGEPKINFGSSKQVQNLFYNVMGITPRIFNSLTENQRSDDVMRSAFKKVRQRKDGKVVEFTAQEREALISKASTDDSAVDTALFYDNLSDRKREVLGAYKTIKEVTTRRNLFYKTWRVIAHWRDGRVHASLNQAEAATRRYSASSPNVQQMPSRGPGADFRRIVQPHHRKAVIVSCDFSGQELRGLAHQCKDEALTACYVGDNLLDVHSLTAVQASVYLWGELVAYDEFLKMLKSDDKEVAKRAKLLRSQAKTVVFASQYGAQAPNIAQQLFVDEETAQRFLDAKDKAFPRIEQWKKEVEDLAAQRGYALDLMGFRRHLAQALSSENKWEAAKAARQASNFAIQASAACQTLLAMSTMWRKGLFTGRYDAQFYFPIHDECVASVHKDQAVEFIREFHSCMTQPFAGMTIPIVSSIDIGRNFGDLIEIGDDFDEEKISKALDELFAA